MKKTNKELIQEVASRTGLSPLLGPGTVWRALRDFGTSPELSTLEDYYAPEFLPLLKARIAVYLGEEAAEANKAPPSSAP